MTIKERIRETRTRIDEQRDEILERGRKLREDIDRRRNLALGKLKDGSLERLYDVGEQALLTAANLVERAGQLAPKRINVLDDQVQVLRTRATKFEDYKDELHRPAIEGYDELNVSEVNEALPRLDAYGLTKLRAYEAAHKNRVTVLREIDRLLDQATD